MIAATRPRPFDDWTARLREYQEAGDEESGPETVCPACRQLEGLGKGGG
jgi:hypothetical protein